MPELSVTVGLAPVADPAADVPLQYLSGHMLYHDPDDGRVRLGWDVRVDGFDVCGGAHGRELGLNPAFARRWEATYAERADTFFDVARHALAARLAEAFGPGHDVALSHVGSNGGFVALDAVDGIGLSFGSHADWGDFLYERARDGAVPVLHRIAHLGRLADVALSEPAHAVERRYALMRQAQEAAWVAARDADPDHEPLVEVAEEAGLAFFQDHAGDWWAVDADEEVGPFPTEAEAAVALCAEHGLCHAPAMH